MAGRALLTGYHRIKQWLKIATMDWFIRHIMHIAYICVHLLVWLLAHLNMWLHSCRLCSVPTLGHLYQLSHLIPHLQKAMPNSANWGYVQRVIFANKGNYHQISNIKCTFAGNLIHDPSDVVRASPVGAMDWFIKHIMHIAYICVHLLVWLLAHLNMWLHSCRLCSVPTLGHLYQLSHLIPHLRKAMPNSANWDCVQRVIFANNKDNYRQISNIRRTLAGNLIHVHSDVVGASPVSAAPTTSSFST